MIRIVLLCVAALCAGPSFAKVEIEAAEQKNLGRILIAKVSEEIAPGDYEALLRGLRQHPGQFARKILLLDSIGGSAAEAMRMGRLLRETGFDTLVPANGLCQGSCVYLLAAGHRKMIRGHVGLHRPYHAAGESAQAHLAGRPGNPVDYFRDMGVAADLAADMLATEPQHMRVLSSQDLRRYRLN